MGEAMLSALLEKKLSQPRDILVSDVSEARRRYLKQKYAVVVIGNNKQAVTGADVVVLAIKPQNLAQVMAELKGRIKSSQLVLSIIAGAKIETLCIGLSHRRIVRVMPNTPAQIGESMSVWAATGGITARQKKWAGSILGAIGKELYVDNENYLDMATAVSGSGPAYFFLFVEAMVEAAVNIGLGRDTAKKLVLQTMLGSGHLLQKSGRLPSELRRTVTSPGGTTAAALDVLEKGKFSKLVNKAVKAAYSRAQELGK